MHSEVALDEVGLLLGDDQTAWLGVEQAYALLAPSVLGYLRRLMPVADADDVLQRTFVDVWRCREQYDPVRPLSVWVMGIAKHRAMDLLRTRRDLPQADPLRHFDDDGDEDLAERYARAAEVRDALARISAEQRQVLVLAYFDDLSLREVAEWIGAPLGTVKARAARGLRALARELGRTRGDL